MSLDAQDQIYVYVPLTNFSFVKQGQKYELSQKFPNVQKQFKRVFGGKYPGVSWNNFLLQTRELLSFSGKHLIQLTNFIQTVLSWKWEQCLLFYLQ